MDYSKWALTRVDELERRLALLSGGAEEETVDSFEVLVNDENEFVSTVKQKRIEFPVFSPTKSVTIIASVFAKYLYDATYSFSLYVNGTQISSQNKTAKAGEEISFVAVKKLTICQSEPVSVWVSIESEDELLLTILSYSLNVVGECKKIDGLCEYGRFSADFYDENAQTDFNLAEPANQIAVQEQKQRYAGLGSLAGSVEFVVEKIPAYTDGMDIVVHTRISDFGEAQNISGQYASEMREYLSNTNQYGCSIEPASYYLMQQSDDCAEQAEQSDKLGAGQKFALAYMDGNNIYLCQKGQGDDLENLVGQKIARGSKVATCFDKFGNLMIVRQTIGGKLYLSSVSNLSEEIFIDEDVDDFDVARAPFDSSYECVVVAIKNNKLVAKYITNLCVAYSEEINEACSCSKVRAARNCTKSLALIVSGKRNEVVVAKPNPAAQQKNYSCAVSFLVF